MVAMGTTFVRLTVIADSSQLDVSLPAQRPVVEYIDDVVGLLDADGAASPSPWALSSPRHGPIDPEDTLADHGILDGVTLHLTPAQEAAPPPFVDDVIEEVRRTVDARFEPWSGSARRRWTAAASAAALATSGAFLTFHFSSWTAAVPLAVLSVLAVAVALVARRTPSGHLLLAGAALAAGAVWRAAEPVGMAGSVSLAVSAATGLAALWAGSIRRDLSGVVGASSVCLCFAVAGAAFALGANPTAMSMWASIGLVALLIVTPRVALASSGLLAHIRRTERFEEAPRNKVSDALARGRHTADGLVWGSAVLLTAITATIAATGVWEQGLAAAALVMMVLLRSRAFTHTRHVAPLVVAAAVSAAALGCALPGWIPGTGSAAAVAAAAGVLLAGAFVAAGLPDLDAVPAARVRRALNAAGLPLAIAYVPIVFFGQGVYTLVWP